MTHRMAAVQQKTRLESNRTRCCRKLCDWRELAVLAVEAFHAPSSHLTVYQLGVFRGGSMRKLARHLHPSTRFWGFDSFQGLPDSSESQTMDAKEKMAKLHTWHQGEYSADPRDDLRSLFGGRVAFVSGFFNTSLANDDIAEKMSTATYIDVDVDLYVSTRDALDFLLRNRLIQPGTVVGYDDWWVLPCDENTNLTPLTSGEGKAHAEMSRKYGVRFDCVGGTCMHASDEHPSCPTRLHAWGAVFVVAEIGTTRVRRDDDHGFIYSESDVNNFRKRNPRCAKRVTRVAQPRMQRMQQLSAQQAPT